MEAIGGGLPIIGFDVRYGNPTFIDDGKNGYLIPMDEHMTQKEKIEALTDRLIRLFTEAIWTASISILTGKQRNFSLGRWR